MTETAAPRGSGWLFSPAEDLAVFWLPVTAVFLLLNATGASQWNLDGMFFTLVLVRIPVDMGHVWTTVYPLLSRRSEAGITDRAILLGPVVIVAVSLAFVSYSKSGFYTLVAYFAIYHIARQQYGWVMLARRLAREAARLRWLDTLMIWNTMLFPALWWQSEFSSINKSYSTYGSFHLELPLAVLNLFLAAHWIINLVFALVYFGEWRKGRAINWAKISIILSTWCWFYGALVLFPNYYFFFITLALTHGIPYQLYCFRATKQRVGDRESAAFSFFARPHLYVAFFLVAAGLQYLLAQLTPASGQPWSAQLKMLCFAPLFFHYYFDALIWKKRAFVGA